MAQPARPLIEVEYGHNGDRLLALLRKQHPNYHPIVNIAKIAHVAEVDDGSGAPNLELAMRAHATVLRYVEPELKSVEVRDKREKRRAVTVSLFEEGLAPDEPPQALEGTQSPSMALSVIEGELVEGE